MSSPPKSPQRKFVGRKDREKIREMKRIRLEQELIRRQQEQAEQQLSRLKNSGIVEAYDQFLRSLVTDGLIDTSIVYEKAAQYVLQYERRVKNKLKRKETLEKYNSEVLHKNKLEMMQKPQEATLSPSKSKRSTSQSPLKNSVKEETSMSPLRKKKEKKSPAISPTKV